MVCTPQYTLMSRSAVEREWNIINYKSLIKSLHKKRKHSLTGEAAVKVGIAVEPIELRIHYERFAYKQKNHKQTIHFNAWGRQCMSNFFGFIRNCFFFWNARRNAWLDSLQKVIWLHCSVITLLNLKKKDRKWEIWYFCWCFCSIGNQ